MPTPEPRETESLAVGQARMEGKIDVVIGSLESVKEKVTDLKSEVTEHRIAINALQSDVRQVKSDAAEAAKAVLEAEVARKNTADAVAQADAKRVADAKALVDQTASRWAAGPAMRIYVFLGIFVGLVTIWFYITHPHG